MVQGLVDGFGALVMQMRADGRGWIAKRASVLFVVGFALTAGLGWPEPVAARERKTEVVVPIVNKTTKPPPSAPAVLDGVKSAGGEVAMQAAFLTHLQGLWSDARSLGVSQAVFDAAIADLTHDASIVELMQSQPEHTWAPWDYLERLVSDPTHSRWPAEAHRIGGAAGPHREALSRRQACRRGNLGD